MKKKMMIILLLICALQANAQKIHWLLFVDTNRDKLFVNSKEYLKNNMIDVVNAGLNANRIAAEIYDYSGDKLTPENCKNVVKNLRCDADRDIVFFCYIGGGFRSKDSIATNPWPEMNMGQSNPNRFVSLKWVHDQLKAKKPRLLFTIGICGNGQKATDSILQNKVPKPSVTLLPEKYKLNDQQIEHINTLFLNTCGDLLAISARPNQFSYSCITELTGKEMDSYTRAMATIFNEMVENENINFTTLFNRVRENVESTTKNKQTPYVEDHLQYDSCPDLIIIDSTQTPTKLPQCPDLSDIENLLQSIMLNRTDMSRENIDKFAENCYVITVGKDRTTEVDFQSFNDFLLRLKTSHVLLRVIPEETKVSSDCKITELRVSEIIKRK